jgi:hypothetical protein
VPALVGTDVARDRNKFKGYDIFAANGIAPKKSTTARAVEQVLLR